MNKNKKLIAPILITIFFLSFTLLNDKIICGNCHVETGGWREKREAVKAWNRRIDNGFYQHKGKRP